MQGVFLARRNQIRRVIRCHRGLGWIAPERRRDRVDEHPRSPLQEEVSELICLPIFESDLPVSVPKVVEETPSSCDGAIPPHLQRELHLCSAKVWMQAVMA